MENNTTFIIQNSKKWINPLLSYFINIKSIDDNIEFLRISLCSLPNFSSNKLFQYLDKSSKNFLSLNDFIEFLEEMRIPFEERYLRIFIHNFDKDGDFSINKKEFLGLILPKKNINLAEKVKKNENNYNNNIEDIVTNNMKNIFGKILCEELELVKNCIISAKSCKEIMGFTLFEAFCLISEKNKYITNNLLYNFLLKNNVDINMNDIHQLMFRLDADNDGKISFEEFKEIFFPIKGEEIIYKNKYNYIVNNCNYINFEKIEKENKEKFLGNKGNKINNLVNFTFGKKTNKIYRNIYKNKKEKIND